MRRTCPRSADAARRSAARHTGWLALAAVALACTAAVSPCRASPPTATDAPLLGTASAQAGALRLGLTPNMLIVFRPRPWQPPGPQTDALPPAQESLGLEFKSAKPGPSARNLFRLQLTSDSMLQFRPRHGGLTVNYGAQF